MIEIVFSELADTNSHTIFEYLYENAGEKTALKYRAMFDKLYQNLEDFPDNGVSREKLGANVRVCFADPYIMFYTHVRADNIVKILRILHGRREVTIKSLNFN